MTNGERRMQDIPVPYERRLEERIAVLEIRVENSANRDIDTADKVDQLISKLDDHIEDEYGKALAANETMTNMSNTVNNLVHEIKRTNDMLVKFTEMMMDTRDKVNNWDITRKNIVTAITVVFAIGGVCWGIFDFAADHTDLFRNSTPTVVQGK
jgi:hypothetical protein